MGRTLLFACRDTTVCPETIDQALHSVSLAVDDAVKRPVALCRAATAAPPQQLLLPTSGACRVLVGTYNSTAHVVGRPVDSSVGVGFALQRPQDPLPDSR